MMGGTDRSRRCSAHARGDAAGEGCEPLERSKIPLYWHRGYRRARSRFGALVATLRHGSNFVPTRNVGDDLSPIVVGRLTERDVVAVSARRRGKVIAIGSILGATRHRDTIWGTGLPGIDGARLLRGKRSLCIRALRGPLTRRAVEQEGHPCPEVYGDPALLMPLVHPLERSSTHRLGVVPHKKDVMAFREVHASMKSEEIAVIDPAQSWETFLDRLLQCRRVVSGSLHGLILAEAYGIPAGLMRFREFPRNDPFKYEDYMESTSRRLHYLDMSEPTAVFDIEEFVDGCEPPSLDLSGLLRALPLGAGMSRLAGPQAEVMLGAGGTCLAEATPS